MKLHVLFGQRPQYYDGQYAPEALAVIDEFTHDDCDVWIHEQYHEEYAKGVFESLRIIEIEIDRDKLDTIFKPSPLQGDVSDPTSDLVTTCNTIIEGISARKEHGSVLSIEEEYIRIHLTGALKKIQDLTS